MRFLPFISLLLLVQLLAGCETLRPSEPASPQAPNVFEDTPAAQVAPDAAGQCPPVEAVVCAEPEVKVVERVIERKFEKIVEVPVAKDKLVLGSEEYFVVEPGGLRLKALVDTGAATCSLSVVALTPFERDGSDWVRFDLSDGGDGEPVKIELPIKRHVRVARPGFDRQRRPVVNMSLTIGEVTHMVEVNLVERGEFDFPLLVGRNFLKDAAVVDVSRKLVQGNGSVSVVGK
ncbi:RimK/LysX family protein [Microbulbifer sp. HZ11]|uniref:ATP-dependent zinc protease family protein n=1 Tax=unclassified Microbulbifer TaxID=2619833 RepID=UPI00068AC725|nr:RimK/LysX family protein [Microbulbifer sp. HZ11]